MIYKYKLTKKVEDFVSNCEVEEIGIGCSNSQVVKITKNNDTYFLKMAPKGMLEAEYNKLKWLEGKLEVPKVVIYDYSKATEFLITAATVGEMICSDYYLKNPNIGIQVLVEAFNKITSVSLTDCPFDVSIDYKIALVEKNVREHLVTEKDLKKETLEKYDNLENILTYLKENRFKDEPCFSHGDTSLPNVFAKDNHFRGFIDVGECGIADRWFDLVICEKSIKRNYGEDYIPIFYQALGIVPDRFKIDYYLLMMELYL